MSSMNKWIDRSAAPGNPALRDGFTSTVRDTHNRGTVRLSDHASDTATPAGPRPAAPAKRSDGEYRPSETNHRTHAGTGRQACNTDRRRRGMSRAGKTHEPHTRSDSTTTPRTETAQ